MELPNTVELEVTETEPGIKGDTASGGTKPATLETGLVVQVPFFINQGDHLIINTTESVMFQEHNLNIFQLATVNRLLLFLFSEEMEV